MWRVGCIIVFSAPAAVLRSNNTCVHHIFTHTHTCYTATVRVCTKNTHTHSLTDEVCQHRDHVPVHASRRHTQHLTPCAHTHTPTDAVCQHRDHGPIHAPRGHTQHLAHGRLSSSAGRPPGRGEGVCVLLCHTQRKPGLCVPYYLACVCLLGRVYECVCL